MKKIFSVLIMLTVLAISIPCFAITNEDLQIGDIYVGKSFSEVTKAYGQPINKTQRYTGFSFSFNDNLTVETTPDEKYVIGVVVKGNMDLATKGGIRIGSTLKDIKSVYGAPSNEGEVAFKGAEPYYRISYQIQQGPKEFYFFDFHLNNAGGNVTLMTFYKFIKQW